MRHDEPALREQLATRLRRETRGEVLFSRADRGRYATDASIYQIEPVGVFVPRTIEDVTTAMAIARESDVPVLAARRGHQSMRPDGQPSVGSRLLEISPQRARNRPRPATRIGRAGDRAWPSQRGPQAAWPVLSGRSVDARALHHRRHGGQQFLWREVDPLWPDGRQCRGHRCDSRGRRAFPLRSRLARTGRDEARGHREADGPGCRLWAKIWRRRSPPDFRKCCAGSAGTTSML